MSQQLLEPDVESAPADPDAVQQCDVQLTIVERHTRETFGWVPCPEPAAASVLARWTCGRLAPRRLCLGHLADAIRGGIDCGVHGLDRDDVSSVVSLDTGSGS